MIVYLAGPIAAIGRTGAMVWRERLRRALEEKGISTFDPAAAWLVAGGRCAGIRSPVQFVDNAAIAICDVVVVACTIHESKGTDDEIQLALALGKPIAVYSFLPEASAEAWTRERGLHDAPVLCDETAIVNLLAGWKRNWKCD